jgi:hypothetical protein
MNFTRAAATSKIGVFRWLIPDKNRFHGFFYFTSGIGYCFIFRVKMYSPVATAIEARGESLPSNPSLVRG